MVTALGTASARRVNAVLARPTSDNDAVKSVVVATVRGEHEPESHAAVTDRPGTLCGLPESSLVRSDRPFRPDIGDSCDLCAAEVRSLT